MFVSFVKKHKGCNFINIQPTINGFSKYKVLCRHFLVDNPYYRKYKLLRIVNHGIAYLQKPFMNNNTILYHGSSLFSISAEFAEYVLHQEKEIAEKYKYALAGDEDFLQTVFMNSPFKDTLYGKNGARLIDWKRKEGNSRRG